MSRKTTLPQPKPTHSQTFVLAALAIQYLSWHAVYAVCKDQSVVAKHIWRKRGTKEKLRKSSNKISLLLYLDFALQDQAVSFEVEWLCIYERTHFKVFWGMLCLYASSHRLQQLWGKNVCCLVLKQFWHSLA